MDRIGLGAIAGLALLNAAVPAGAASTPPDATADANAIAARALKEMEAHYPAGVSPVRRDAHAKAHGCAKAIFTVDRNIPTTLQVGSFASPGAAYKAWVRFSNGAFHPGPDTGLDGRGMAVKILGVAPDTPSKGPASAHDILMINHPVFFSGDARDYRAFAEAGALTGDNAGLKAYFVPSWNPLAWRGRQGMIAYRIASQPIRSPLSAEYYSMTAFALGAGRAIKYAARPCGGHSSTSDPPKEQGPNYLREALKADLSAGPACYELLAQERRDGMPVDDATTEWSEDQSPYRRLGEIVFPRQAIDQPGEDAFCEDIAFSPWNTPPESQPLGSINQVRKTVYEAISQFRHARNGAPVPDAASAWDRF